MKKLVIDRVLSRIEKIPESGCWIFMGALHDSGYGICGIEGTKVDRVHRITYRHFIGEIPKGLFVLHRCDVRACCNPHHLFIGTNQDNVNDMIAKGRNSKPPRNLHDIGSNRYNAKMDESKVLEARKMYDSGVIAYKLSKIFGVSAATMNKICKRQTWRHLP